MRTGPSEKNIQKKKELKGRATLMAVTGNRPGWNRSVCAMKRGNGWVRIGSALHRTPTIPPIVEKGKRKDIQTALGLDLSPVKEVCGGARNHGWWWYWPSNEKQKRENPHQQTKNGRARGGGKAKNEARQVEEKNKKKGKKSASAGGGKKGGGRL